MQLFSKDMFRLLFTTASLVIVAAAAAAATEIQITGGPYGNAAACALYVAGGGNAVFSGGASVGSNLESEDDPDYMIVSRAEVVGYEWACEPQEIAGGSVTLQCPGSQVSSDFGEPELVTVIISENISNGTLSYTDERGKIVLHRCSP